MNFLECTIQLLWGGSLNFSSVQDSPFFNPTRGSALSSSVGLIRPPSIVRSLSCADCWWLSVLLCLLMIRVRCYWIMLFLPGVSVAWRNKVAGYIQHKSELRSNRTIQKLALSKRAHCLSISKTHSVRVFMHARLRSFVDGTLPFCFDWFVRSYQLMGLLWRGSFLETSVSERTINLISAQSIGGAEVILDLVFNPWTVTAVHATRVQ